MKKLTILFCLGLLLTGCGIGGHWMNGNPYTQPIKPYIQKWEKTGATPEERRQDSAKCGGGTSDSPGFSHRTEKEKLPGESWRETYYRLFDDWERCMLKAGYRYVGECYDNEISRSSPACMGRTSFDKL